MQTRYVLGIDIGGTGIKGAVVDFEKGELVDERVKIDTPVPSTTEAVAETVAALVKQIGYDGDLIGCGFPSIVKHGVAYSAANIHPSWIGTNVEQLFSGTTGKKVFATNDADAAGLSEMRFGRGRGVKGVVLLITIGTGLGSALFVDGHLVPNTELGHIPWHGGSAEHYVSNTARKKFDLTWEEFGKRFNDYLHMVDRLFSPGLFILGGGVSNKYSQFSEWIQIDTEVVTAETFNNAGIIGAALYAYETHFGEMLRV